MTETRTREQEEFDLAIKGWSFCSLDMLKKRLPLLHELATKLPTDDVRHRRLEIVEGAVLGIPI